MYWQIFIKCGALDSAAEEENTTSQTGVGGSPVTSGHVSFVHLGGGPTSILTLKHTGFYTHVCQIAATYGQYILAVYILTVSCSDSCVRRRMWSQHSTDRRPHS